MKTIDSALAEYIAGRNEYVTFDLYRIDLVSDRLYITDADIDLRYNNITYSHNYCIISRDLTRVDSELSSDTIDVTLMLPEGSVLQQYAHAGSLDGVSLRIDKAFYDLATGTIIGVVNIYAGYCMVSTAGGLELVLSVENKATSLNVDFPVRSFSPSRAYAESNDTLQRKTADPYACPAPLKPVQRLKGFDW